MSEPKLLSISQVGELVPKADGPWLRWLISQGAVRTVRIGYHVLLPAGELSKISQLAAARRKSR
jgi:hypothetical protein